MFARSESNKALKALVGHNRRLTAVAVSVALAGTFVTWKTMDSASAASCSVAVAADVAGAGDLDNAKATAKLIKEHAPAKVIAPGDLAYSNGTAKEFDNYFDAAWGSLKPILLPSPGNHEYNSDGKGYYGYYKGLDKNYGTDVCGWRVISLDPYASMVKAVAFIKSDAKANPGKPIAVSWHAPRFSSGSEHGSDTESQALWAASVAVGAKLVLNGHDHNYERFAPMNANGKASATGTREFVSGNGGHNLRKLGKTVSNSEKRIAGTPGVLFLTLRSTGYDWRYEDIKGAVGDEGTVKFPSLDTSTTTEKTTTTVKITTTVKPSPATSSPATSTPATSTSTSTSTSSTLKPTTSSSSPLTIPSTTAPITGLALVKAAQIPNQDLVVVKISGFPANGRVTVKAVIKDGSGSAVLKANSKGQILMGFQVPGEYLAGPVTVTGTSGSITASSSIQYGLA